MIENIKKEIEFIKELVDYIDDITPDNQSKTDHLGQIVLWAERILDTYEKDLKKSYDDGYKFGKIVGDCYSHRN